MKQSIAKTTNKIWIFVIAVMMNIDSFAQEKAIQSGIDINKGSTQWYNSPWLWIICGAVFILFLTAILRGNSTSD